MLLASGDPRVEEASHQAGAGTYLECYEPPDSGILPGTAWALGAQGVSCHARVFSAEQVSAPCLLPAEVASRGRGSCSGQPLFPFQFRGNDRGITARFIHPAPTRRVPNVLGDLIGLGHPTVSFRALSQQAAPQVLLTEATSQGAPDTQEAVLIEEGRQEGGPGPGTARGVQIRCRGEAQESEFFLWMSCELQPAALPTLI